MMFVVGPMKTGTSFLYSAINKNPHWAFPKNSKETLFFDQNYDLGFNWYLSQYNVSRETLNSEGCEFAPSYFHSSDAIKRIHSSFPQAKIVIILRDPVARAYSHYMHLRRYGMVSSELESLDKNHEIFEGSRYRFWINEWRSHFGDESVLLVSYNDVVRSVADVVDAICKFNGTRKAPISTVDLDLNTGVVPKFFGISRIANSVAHWLRRHRMTWIIELGRLIGLREVFFGGGRYEPMTLPQKLYIQSRLGADQSIDHDRWS